jgi:nucleoside-diphosphate kinase
LPSITLVNLLEDVLRDMEQTLVLVKPDGVQRGLVGQVISRLERRGLKLVAMKLMQVDDALARQHYGEHVERPFFRGLVDFITSGPLVAMVWESENAVNLVRQTMGATDPVNSAPGTIRGDFGVSIGRNLVHGSDGLESAKREINLFFRPEEILDYNRSADLWITEP